MAEGWVVAIQRRKRESEENKSLRERLLNDKIVEELRPFIDEQAQFMGRESPAGLVDKLETSRSMNPFLQSMRDSGVPEPTVQFLQNNPYATKEDIQSALTISADAATSKTGGRGEYFVPIQTAKGIYSFNSRTGELRDLGGNVVGSSSDPELQGKLAGAKEYGKSVGEEAADVGRVIDMGTSIQDATRMLDKGIYSGF